MKESQNIGKNSEKYQRYLMMWKILLRTQNKVDLRYATK